MNRCWLLTWTTYGTWLPGDPRGSVTSVREAAGPRMEHDTPGTPIDGPMPGLRAAARDALKGVPIYLSREQAEVLLGQFQETAAYRRWQLLGVAIMANHVHLVVAVPGDPSPETILGDLKSYGSRSLNRRWGKPVNGSWWSGGSGSKRKLSTEEAVRAALDYVKRQECPLVLWFSQGEPGASAPGA